MLSLVKSRVLSSRMRTALLLVVISALILSYYFSSYRISDLTLIRPLDQTESTFKECNCTKQQIPAHEACPEIKAPVHEVCPEPRVQEIYSVDNGNTNELDVEQIASDFPLGYQNPNHWFSTPGQPNYKELRALASQDELALLPGFGPESRLSPKQLEKINSFYGINRTGPWQDHINLLDDEGLSPLTKWAQQYIYDHQHPKSCEGKRFYVLRNGWPNHGLGALIRRVFIELTLAIQADRILVFDYDNAPGNTLVERDCARHRSRNASLECVIEDISSCASYVTPENSVTSINMSHVAGGKRLVVPPLPTLALASYLGETDIAPSGTLLRYWWRSQLYGYVLRPNRAVLNRMVQMRLDGTHKGVGTSRHGAHKSTNRTVPFPLPPSTISIHIRHGDKAGEGRLISTRDYIVAAERFILRNPLRYLKRGFISTEDPKAIEEAVRTPGVNLAKSYPNLDWTWYYSDIPRVNGGPRQNLVLTHNKTDALITHIMQLWMAVECDTFVGNRNSNWNRLIDAIRCTLMDKCRAPYLEAGFRADWINFP